MKLLIDNLSASTGWTDHSGGSFYSVNDHADYIAGNNVASLVFKFSALGGYVEKVFSTPVTVTGYKILTLHVFSLNYTGNNRYRTSDDFAYKISLGTGKDYYLPIYNTLTPITIDISDLTTIEKIKVTALTADSDYLVLSYAVASTDEFPLDIFDGIKEQIEKEITDNYATLYPLGTIPVALNDGFVQFLTEAPFIDRYAVVDVVSTGHTERHHIDSSSGRKYLFSDLYDGKKILYAAVSAVVYLAIPVEYQKYQSEVTYPGITLWGLEGTPKPVSNTLDHYIDTFKVSAGTFAERREGQYVEYVLTIDCEARHNELLAVMSRIIRDVLGRRKIWVNGRKIDITMDRVTNIDPVEAFNSIPKIEYVCFVTVKEELYSRSTLPKTTDIDFTATID